MLASIGPFTIPDQLVRSLEYGAKTGPYDRQPLIWRQTAVLIFRFRRLAVCSRQANRSPVFSRIEWQCERDRSCCERRSGRRAVHARCGPIPLAPKSLVDPSAAPRAAAIALTVRRGAAARGQGGPERRPGVTDFGELIRALSGSGVKFVLVGGVAATLHGSASLTQDVDVVYARDEDNLSRIARRSPPCSRICAARRPGCRSGWTRKRSPRG